MISETRLLEPKRPQRWKGRWASEPCVSRQHVLCIRPIKDVVIEGAVLRAKRVRVRRFFAKIETCPPSVVKQHSRGHTFPCGQKKWDALVDSVCRLLKAIAIRIPHAIGMVSPVEWPWLVPQPK